MKPEDQIKELAELDGLVYDNQSPYMSLVWRRGATYQQLPGYLTSYDAIIPLIQKQDKDDTKVGDMFYTKFQDTLLRLTYPTKLNPPAYSVEELMVGCYALQCMLTATPSQLCEALLRATGKWKE